MAYLRGMSLVLNPVATLRSALPRKFGVPRQSGLVPLLRSRIVFEPEYRNPDALRGLEGYSRLWLIWHFSQGRTQVWSPTVRPPRLGGNRRMGVFATRSPFRPNPLGLSCVRIEAVRPDTPEGPVIEVSGADLVDGTPIFDIKPYLPHIEAFPDAKAGFAGQVAGYALRVEVPDALRREVDPDYLAALEQLLAQDPRPSYHDDPDRVYGFTFLPYEARFRVEKGVAYLVELLKI